MRTIERLVNIGCPNLNDKVTWANSRDEVDVAGGLYDIYVAKLEGYNNPVAVKYARYGIQPLLIEVEVISSIRHPNVLGFLGFITDVKPTKASIPSEIGVVYPWVDLNLRMYLTMNPDANRCDLCLQVANGLVYLHNAGVIHGDLRSRNIMMSESSHGMIKITGFGGSVLERETPDPLRELQRAPRWAAPERFSFSRAWPTRKSDVWSLGMTIYEVLTGETPFRELSDLRVILLLGNGGLPPRPPGFISLKSGYNEIVWGLLLSCWKVKPEDRPSTEAVRDFLTLIEREGHTSSKANVPTHVVIEHKTALPTMIERLVDQGCSDVTTQLTYIEEKSVYAGKLSDVYQARMVDGTLVAVKCLRQMKNSENKPDKVLKHTAHELYAWSVSTHPNVLELIGMAVFRDKLAMVAPWMEYGSLLSYIEANPGADRCDLCAQIAEGLVYMHGSGIAHGDIKGDNVVVSKEGIVKITDFGCATMKREFPIAFTATESLSYSVRWAAPELFLENAATSFETDVYALAMTVLEALTGDVPHKSRADLSVIHTVLVKKELPTRPVELIRPNSRKGDALWAMLSRCWSHEPESRPKIGELRDFLRGVTQAEILV